MQYNRLGKAGLVVSELSFGSWVTFGGNLDVDQAKATMRAAHEAGVNFFDNAETYAAGISEAIMAMALKEYRREDLVVSTKIFWGGEGPNQEGLNRKHLFEGTKNSLKRLDLEYVDLLFCHRPDPETPVEETVYAMNDLVRAGYAFYWGTSEWPAERIAEACDIAERRNLICPTMEQPRYNMFERKRVEKEYRPLFEHYGIGTTIWSPLASGFLTGKYRDGIPEGSRLSKLEWLRDVMTRDGYFNKQAMQRLDGLAALAEELGCTMAQLAIAWCLKNPDVSTVITGASSVDQVRENMKAVEVRDMLDAGVMKRIEGILDNRP